VAKIALLIGVSEYAQDFNPIPAAEKDIVTMQRVLKNPEMGGFDQVNTLSNPEPTAMQRAIEALFSDREKDDLVLLFFSGHGVKDDRGRLYFATRATCKNSKKELVKATAVPATFVQDIMSSSRCKRQVIILDCCFSGAFAEGMTAKDDGTVDIKNQLGGKGQVILTSSTSTQYSFAYDEADLSMYTRYLTEGIESGAADLDSDGMVSLDELHEYASQKVREAAPAMNPEIYRFKEGHKILLTKAPVTDPKLRYRKEVEKFAGRGRISVIGRSALDVLRDRLALSLEVTSAIEAEVLKPHQEHRKNLLRYEQALREAIASEKNLTSETQDELNSLQQFLGLRDEDVEPIKAEIASTLVAVQTEGQYRQLAEQYAQALNHLRHERWEEAEQLLSAIIAQQPDYEEAAKKLAEAKRQQQIAELMTQAETAYTQQAWTEVIQALEAILAIDPNHRDIKTRLERAKRQKQLADLYDQARRWHRGQKWQRVIDIHREIRALDKAYPDSDNLWSSARQHLKEGEHQNRLRRLADLYSQGQHSINTGKWQQAAEIFEEISHTDPNYSETKALLARAHNELAQDKPLFVPIVIILGGWIVAGLLAKAKPDLSGIAGAIGAFINVLVFLAVYPDRDSVVSWKLLLQFLAFSVVGAIVWFLFWQLLTPRLNNIVTLGMQGFLEPALSALCGVGVLVGLHRLVWTRSEL
jgi:uncharacterized caspase-like protein